MRLIDADALMKALDDFCKWCKDGRLQGAEFCLDCMIPNAPTIEPSEVSAKHEKVRTEPTEMLDVTAEDAIKIVRCEECKYLGIKDFVYGYCKKNMVGEVQPDDFCSYGERRQKKK